MNKAFKITGIVLLAFIGLLLSAFLPARFGFREQVSLALNDTPAPHRIEVLREAAL